MSGRHGAGHIVGDDVHVGADHLTSRSREPIRRPVPGLDAVDDHRAVITGARSRETQLGSKTPNHGCVSPHLLRGGLAIGDNGVGHRDDATGPSSGAPRCPHRDLAQ